MLNPVRCSGIGGEVVKQWMKTIPADPLAGGVQACPKASFGGRRLQSLCS